MTLQEAIAQARSSGGLISRPGMDSFSASDLDNGDVTLTTGDVLATNYTVLASSLSISEADFVDAWNAARSRFSSIKPFGESEFSRVLLNAIKERAS